MSKDKVTDSRDLMMFLQGSNRLAERAMEDNSKNPVLDTLKAKPEQFYRVSTDGSPIQHHRLTRAEFLVLSSTRCHV